MILGNREEFEKYLRESDKKISAVYVKTAEDAYNYCFTNLNRKKIQKVIEENVKISPEHNLL